MNFKFPPKKYLSKFYQICENNMTDEEFNSCFNQDGTINIFPNFATFMIKNIPSFKKQDMLNFTLGLIEYNLNNSSILSNYFFFDAIKNNLNLSEIDFYNILIDDKEYGPQFFIDAINSHQHTEYQITPQTYLKNELKELVSHESVFTYNNKPYHQETFVLLKKYIKDLDTNIHDKSYMDNSANPYRTILNIAVGTNECIEDFEIKSQNFCDKFMKQYFNFPLTNESVYQFFKNDAVTIFLKHNHLNLNNNKDNSKNILLLRLPSLYISYAKYGDKICEYAQSKTFQKFLKDNHTETTNGISCNIPSHRILISQSNNYQTSTYLFIFSNFYQKILPVLEELRTSENHDHFQDDIQYILQKHHKMFNKKMYAQKNNGGKYDYSKILTIPHEIINGELSDYLLNYASKLRQDNISVKDLFNNLRTIFPNNNTAQAFYNQEDISKNILLNFISQFSLYTYSSYQVEDKSFETLNNDVLLLSDDDLKGLNKIFEYFLNEFKTSYTVTTFDGITTEKETLISSKKNTIKIHPSKNYETLYHIAELLKDYRVLNVDSNPSELKSSSIHLLNIQLEREVPINKVPTKTLKF